MDKKSIIDTIEKAESFAKGLLEISFKQDLFEISQKSLNDEHERQLISEMYTNIYNQYYGLKNYYKASNEQFEFLKTQFDTLDENERFDFIATVLVSFIDFQPEDSEGNLLKKDALNQINNLETIVTETHLLRLKLNVFKKTIDEAKKNNVIEPEAIETKLNLQQIALKYVYEKQNITEENKNEIAISYGWKSGQKLKTHYDYFYKTANRTGEPKDCTIKKISNKIELFESIIPLLNVDAKQILDEIKILKTIKETNYL